VRRYWWQEPLDDRDAVWAPCGHRLLWQARDLIWRCLICQPPAPFEYEHDGVIDLRRDPPRRAAGHGISTPRH
jgi:hypothetical protein